MIEHLLTPQPQAGHTLPGESASVPLLTRWHVRHHLPLQNIHPAAL